MPFWNQAAINSKSNPTLFVEHFLELTFATAYISGEDALPNGLDVTFEVTELRRMTGSYNTMVGNNEGSMVSAPMDGRSRLNWRH